MFFKLWYFSNFNRGNTAKNDDSVSKNSLDLHVTGLGPICNWVHHILGISRGPPRKIPYESQRLVEVSSWESHRT